MSNWIRSLGALAIGLALLVTARAGSLCEQLADEARRQPAAAWAAGADPLQQVLQIARRPPGQQPTALERELIGNPKLREALDAPADELLDVERLAGTDVYRIDSVQGTARCQSMVFVEARPGTAPRPIEAPVVDIPCVTQRGDFGHLAGQPLFVVHGAADMLQLERRYLIVPWTDRGWGQTCTLTTEFRQRLQLAGRYCSADARLCEAGRDVAVGIAEAYEAARTGGPELQPLSFTAGRMPDPELLRAASDLDRNALPAFPAFGADARWLNFFEMNYANVEPASLVLWLDGRWWLGVVGRAGVGWREGSVSLLALFALHDGALVPMAGYQVRIVNDGLSRAVVEEETGQK
jgi:hypothetical protein